MSKYIRVVLGSASDKDVLAKSGFAQTVKNILGNAVEVEYAVYSAHRNAKELEGYVKECLENGTIAFVGIAGLAAALPGALAGLSGMKVPVIAVPLDEHGIDSCLYMPPGVPVLLSGVGKTGLKNAAIAVCQIAATTSDGVVAGRLAKYLEDNAKQTELFDSAELES